LSSTEGATRVPTRDLHGRDGKRSRGGWRRHRNQEAQMSAETEQSAGATAIRPFNVDVPEEELAELRRRVEATRLPSRELVADRSQGVQLATMDALTRY